MATKLEKYLKARDARAGGCSNCGYLTLSAKGNTAPVECVRCNWKTYTGCVVDGCGNQGVGLIKFRSYTTAEPICEIHLDAPRQLEAPLMFQSEVTDQLDKMCSTVVAEKHDPIVSFDKFRLMWEADPIKYKDWDKTLHPNKRDLGEQRLQMVSNHLEIMKLAVSTNQSPPRRNFFTMVNEMHAQQALFRPSAHALAKRAAKKI